MKTLKAILNKQECMGQHFATTEIMMSFCSPLPNHIKKCKKNIVKMILLF